MSVFADGMILYVDNPKDLIIKLGTNQQIQ